MNAIYKMLTEAGRLQTGAAIPEASADQLRKIMLETANNLMIEAEHASPLWGALAGAVKDLEKGPRS